MTNVRNMGSPDDLQPPSDGLQDMSGVPSVEVRHDTVSDLSGRNRHAGDGEVARHAIQSPDPTRLRAIHTPGHASNHVCFLLEEEGLLFSGDHVLDGVTPVILPPHGDMAAYGRAGEESAGGKQVGEE